MTTPIILAKWSSKGGRWTAHLERDASGYTLREFKHGQPVGACFRPVSYFAENAPYAETNEARTLAALQWAGLQVANGFDVAMSRVAV